MILVTVGSLLPFDRMIDLMDDWAARHPQIEVFAQIGSGRYVPRHMQYLRLEENDGFLRRLERASLVVAHAGIGTILDATALGKPMVLVPRRAAWGEHTTDHQSQTVRTLLGRPGIAICERVSDISRCIRDVTGATSRPDGFSTAAPADFIARLRTALLA